MREYTSFLKRASRADYTRITHTPQTVLKRMTPEQREQHKRDKMESYTKRWNGFLEYAETVAQKRICNTMLVLISKYTE